MGIKVTIKGVTELQAKLESMVELTAVKKIVEVNGNRLHNNMVREAVFKRHTPMAPKLYSTGATKRSITSDFRDGGLTAVVAPGTFYSPYVEYGTRKMAAQPFVRPAFDAAKGQFISDMMRLVQ